MSPYYYDPEHDHRPMIRCASHRARTELEMLLRRTAADGEPFGSWQTSCTGGFVAIPLRLLGDAVRIKGCTRATLRFRYCRCL